MRHHDKNRKFGRKTDVRRAFLRSIAEALIKNGKITTTEARAREIRPYVEKLVTRAKNDTVAARRIVASKLGTAQRAEKLFTEIAPKYKERAGGYTRIIKLPTRGGDGSRMAMIEFV